LVANRGEIALRVIRGCHEQGVEAVAVYSAIDVDSPHVRAADTAFALGGTTSAESYLRSERLIEAAHATGCDAVHPGYGFLSERASFAREVNDAGLVFIGPPASAIAAMGDKLAARARMKQAGVPVVPGTEQVAATDPRLSTLALEVGYPLIVKAAAGGGGKGMRIVESPEGLAAAVRQAASEAGKSFGDAAVFLERYLTAPRHIEIQVLGDQHGSIIHLGERECSIQRRHQKLIEEAPSIAINEELRARMGAAAVAAARAVGYYSTGTVEFLFESGEFYFLEMNTRLQVEHPVTEWVYGVDLVAAQLEIAAGRPLRWTQAEICPRGHAIECRITAEDAVAGFVPSPGRIVALHEPAGPFVRFDSGVCAGVAITPHYDPLIAKLIVWGADREAAIARMARALRETLIVGVTTTIPFHRQALASPRFHAGDTTTRFVQQLASDVAIGRAPAEECELVAQLAAALAHQLRQEGTTAATRDAAADPWLLIHRARNLH
jgi:acetyl-CoA carboxylase biotin carboxylase subunit